MSCEARQRTSATDRNFIRLEVEHSNIGVSDVGEGSVTWCAPIEASCMWRSRPKGLVREEEEVFFRALFFGRGVVGRCVGGSLGCCVLLFSSFPDFQIFMTLRELYDTFLLRYKSTMVINEVK